MLDEIKAADAEAPFHLLGGVNTVAGIPHDISKLNIPVNLARGLPRLHHIKGWKQPKGNAPIALIGSGPSLAKTSSELFWPTMCAGSVHDWLVERGMLPTFCVIADPDRIAANYIKHARKGISIEYLVASQCHPAVFDALEGCDVRLWHLYPCDHDLLEKVDPQWEAVGGGCTVGLRCVSIAIMMGYRNLHFFGYDSCYGEVRSHVQDFSEEGEEEFLGETYKVSVNIGLDGPSEKVFRCSGYMMAQAQHFKDLLCEYGAIIEPTFHGPGLLAEYARMYKELRDKAMEAL